MSWFIIALIGPLLYATTNYIDKLLLERYFKQGGVGTIMIFSGLLSVLVLPVLFYLDPTSFDIGFKYIIAMIGVGICNALVLFFYLKALEGDEVSIAIIFYQLVPVFAYILGYFILGERLTLFEIAAMAVIILGTSIVSFEVDTENNFRLRRRTIYFMLGASFCWALGAVIFKAVALEENVIRSLFWEHLVLTFIGIGLFSFVRPYRLHFIEALKTNSRSILSLNVLNEVIYMSGNVAISFAYLLAPIALVLLANSYQALFALIIGVFLTLFFPKLTVEKIQLRHVWQKGLAIAVTAVGTYLLLAL